MRRSTVVALIGAISFAVGADAVGIESTAPQPVVHRDEWPPGVVPGRIPSVQELAAGTGARPAGQEGRAYRPPGHPGIGSMRRHVKPSCSGDGTDGNRVQVIYAVEQGRRDRYRELLPSLRSWIGDVDDTFAASARKTGADFRVRWVHRDCVPVIAKEVVPQGALSRGFHSTVRALSARGYKSKTRKYLVFADSADLCGIAGLYLDSRKHENNNDGRFPMFARVDSPCWAFPDSRHSVAAHELMHALGGVQRDAPHANPPGSHCVDERDAMCYDDGSGGAMRRNCDGGEALFDCGGNDYFRPRPPRATYLDTHWNTARSSFLDDVSRYATSISAAVSPRRIFWGMEVSIKGQAVRRVDRAPAAAQLAKLYWRKRGAKSWAYLASTTTSDTGRYSFTARPSRTGAFTVRLVPQSAKYAASRSPARTVMVEQYFSSPLLLPVVPSATGG